MNRIAVFEKVSYAEFQKTVREVFDGPDLTETELAAIWERIRIPERATSGSAGYDFFTPFSVELNPGQSVTVPTGIRVRIDEGWFLGCFPKSGLGFKYRLQLDNTVGIVDSDYYYSENEGHIMCRITNDGKTGKTVRLSPLDKFFQGIFLPFGITADDGAAGIRNGGFGSTGV